MNTRPQELERLDSILGVATLTHESSVRLHRRLLGREPATAETSELLAESARIAIVRLPRLAEGVRRLGARWDEENLLDPATAGRTARQIAAEFAVIEPEMRLLQDRLAEIASSLGSLLRS
jgi:hypothetical protein